MSISNIEYLISNIGQRWRAFLGLLGGAGMRRRGGGTMKNQGRQKIDEGCGDAEPGGPLTLIVWPVI
jgi:hypothetical protein